MFSLHKVRATHKKRIGNHSQHPSIPAHIFFGKDAFDSYGLTFVCPGAQEWCHGGGVFHHARQDQQLQRGVPKRTGHTQAAVVRET